MKDVYDDSNVVGLLRRETFIELNDSVELPIGKGVLVVDFELQIRILHKVISRCTLPGVGKGRAYEPRSKKVHDVRSGDGQKISK